jgi:hypothetical protein
VWQRHWDDSVYAGLLQLHQSKCFDPEGLDIARYFDHSVYQLSSETNVPFAHGMSSIPLKSFLAHSKFILVDGEDYYSDKDNQDPFGMDESDDSSLEFKFQLR